MSGIRRNNLASADYVSGHPFNIPPPHVAPSDRTEGNCSSCFQAPKLITLLSDISMHRPMSVQPRLLEFS